MSRRRFKPALILLLLSGTLFAQPVDKKSFAKLVKNTSDAVCPRELEGCVVDSFFYRADYLHQVITMRDDYMLDRDQEALKRYFADMFRYRFEMPDFTDIYGQLLKMDGGITIDMTLDSSRRSFSMTYTPEEFKQIWNDRKKPEYQDSVVWIARHGVFTSLWFQNKYGCSDTVTEVYPLGLDSVWLSLDTVVFHTMVLDSEYPAVLEVRDTWLPYWRETFLFYDDRYLLDDMVDAGYHFLVVYENVSRTDSFHVLIPNPELEALLLQASEFTEATDEQVERYMHEVIEKATREDWEGTVQEDPDIYQSVVVSCHDGMLEVVLQIKENMLNFNMPPAEFTSLKNLYCNTFKHYLESSLETPYIMDDTVLVTLEDVYRNLKGYRTLHIEENTMKALDVVITTDELRNAKLPVAEADEVTRQKIGEQMLAEKYAQEVVQFTRELCPIETRCNVIDSLVYDYQDLHYYSHLVPSCQLNGDTDLVKQEMAKQLKFTTTQTSLYSRLAELGGGLRVHIRDPKEDRLVTVYFTPKEVWDLVNGDTLTDRDRALLSLNDFIASTNAHLPVLLDFMTRVDSLSIEDGKLVYHHTILSQFEKAKEERATLQWVVRNQLISGDAQVAYQMLLCVRSGYGLCYRYKPLTTSKKPKKKPKKVRKSDILDFCFSVEELEGMLF